MLSCVQRFATPWTAPPEKAIISNNKLKKFF